MKKTVWIGAGLVLLAVAVPRRVYTADEYAVTVTDDAGKPLPQMKVRQLLQDYSFGANRESTSEILTDGQGAASFPTQVRWLSFGEETVGCARQILRQGAHSSCGSYTDVSVEPEKFVEAGRSEVADPKQGHRRLLTIRMRSCPSGDWITCTQDRSTRPR